MTTLADLQSFCKIYKFHGFHAPTGHKEWERFYLHHGELQIARFSIYNGQVYSVKWYAFSIKYGRAMIAWQVYARNRRIVSETLYNECWQEAINALKALELSRKQNRTALDIDRAMQGLPPKKRSALAPIDNERIYRKACEIIMQRIEDEASDALRS